jgi:hypothetical protein
MVGPARELEKMVEAKLEESGDVVDREKERRETSTRVSQWRQSMPSQRLSVTSAGRQSRKGASRGVQDEREGADGGEDGKNLERRRIGESSHGGWEPDWETGSRGGTEREGSSGGGRVGEGQGEAGQEGDGKGGGKGVGDRENGGQGDCGWAGELPV